jgi:hypothetical protein
VGYSPFPPVKGQAAQVIFFVDVADPNGDWVGGKCHFGTGVNVPLQAPGVPANATSGTGQCVVNETISNTTVEIDLSVIDLAGNQSNVLSGTVGLEGRGRS